MAYKEPHFDKAGAAAFLQALGQTNSNMVKKSTAKKSTGGNSPSKGTGGKKSK